nr:MULTISPECIES: PIN domain-containing protein [Microcystis]
MLHNSYQVSKRATPLLPNHYHLLEELTQGCEILPVSLETLEYAVKLRDRYLISFWDSLIVASAVLGDATILYSEDMQDGLIINNSLQVINPFKDLNS